jgi:cell division protein ZapD
VITYEYPLNERIRTLLRLEDLFERSRHFVARSEPHDHHMALLTLFEIMEVAGRADLKSDLLQELERQKQVLLSFRNNPDIAEDALASVVRDIEQAAQALFSMTGKIGQYLRENDWLMSIILRILRESGKPQAHSAAQGTFQQMLGGKTAQMLRLRLDAANPVVPEISANKYVLNIRFMAQNAEDPRPRTADWDVGFELTFCNL